MAAFELSNSMKAFVYASYRVGKQIKQIGKRVSEIDKGMNTLEFFRNVLEPAAESSPEELTTV